jgi:hypothetical protein
MAGGLLYFVFVGMWELFGKRDSKTETDLPNTCGLHVSKFAHILFA